MSESSFHWYDPVKKYVSRTVEELCAHASTSFIARDFTWFPKNPFLNFQLEPYAGGLVLAVFCWATNKAQYRSSIWLILYGYSLVSVAYVHDKKKLKQAIAPYNFGFRLNFSRRTETVKMTKVALKRKWFQGASIIWTRDAFCSCKRWCFTIYLVSRQRNHLGLKARNSDSNSVKPFRWLAWEGLLWPESWTLTRCGAHRKCSYCFCPVVKPADMNRKLLKNTTSVCSEKLRYSGFILPTKFELKFGFLSKSRIYDA